MNIFKACFLITRRLAFSLVLYFFIFAVMAVITTMANGDTVPTDFAACRPEVTVLAPDSSDPITEGFLTFLSGNCTLVSLPDDETETLQDAIFFHETDLIVFIPEGFSRSPSSEKLQTASYPGSFESYYGKILINRYWNTVTRLLSQFPEASQEEIREMALSSLSVSAKVVTERFDAPSPLPSVYRSFGYILAYILMAHLLMCISNVLLCFQAPAVTMRTLASPTKPWKRRLPLILYSLALAVVSWIFFSVLGLVIYRPLAEGGDFRLVLIGLLNILVFALVAASLALLVSVLIKTSVSQAIACNLISLGFCFLGGVFVPQSMLSESLLFFSRFTPTYWYVRVWDEIFAIPDFSASALSPILSHLLLELGFAAVLFLMSLAAEKIKSRRREAFGESVTPYLP